MPGRLIVPAERQSNKTYLWWKFLCFTALVNIGIWMWAILVRMDMPDFSLVQPILSGIYVFICAFRSFFPRIDLERFCLVDTPLSNVALGRTFATVAEICFSIQCALIVNELGVLLNSATITQVSYVIVPIIVIAQICCWYAALTLNHFWHGIEESAWVVMVLLAAGCFYAGFIELSGIQKIIMLTGIFSCLGSAYIMVCIDIPMYLSRQKSHAELARRYLGIIEGMQDAISRRVHTADWAIWKKETIWITTYFTFGVWLSIAMVFVRFK